MFPKEKVNIAEFFCCEVCKHLTSFVLLMPKKLSVCIVNITTGSSQQKAENKEQKLVFFLLVSEKKSCYEIVKEMKTCSERKKKLVI